MRHLPRAMAALAPHLPEAVLQAAGRLASARNRAEVTGALANHLRTLPPDVLYSRWEGIVADLTQLERDDALKTVARLTPVIKALGGEAALSQTLHAVQTVAVWWP